MGTTTKVTSATLRGVDWERHWAPYDEPTYQTVLEWVHSEDIVLDIGAGDFRLAFRLVDHVQKCFAIEINQSLTAIAEARPRPDNLSIICADAYRYPFSEGITLTVLLMRHCQRFRVIADKLLAVGCRRLITNARWGVGVEMIELGAVRRPYSTLSMGWYACWCGATGFIPGPADRVTPELEKNIQEVLNCPACRVGSD
ncbi:MAG: rRNA adenine N-6-methyltransferase family protein [Candidatus Promineifilaceae bacterium]